MDTQIKGGRVGIESWPKCQFCGRPVNVNNPLLFVDAGNIMMHTDCFARWQGAQKPAPTYWTRDKVRIQLRKIEHTAGVIRITGYRFEQNLMADMLHIDALMRCREADGRNSDFITTFTCTMPTPFAQRDTPAYDSEKVIAQLLDGSPLLDRIKPLKGGKNE